MVVTKPFSDWSASVRRQLRGLTFREESGMRDVVTDEPNVMTFVYFEGNKVVSWGLMSETAWRPHLTFMVFTRRDYRREGYGSEVYKAAMKWRRIYFKGTKVIWFPASPAAKAFFARRRA